MTKTGRWVTTLSLLVAAGAITLYLLGLRNPPVQASTPVADAQPREDVGVGAKAGSNNPIMTVVARKVRLARDLEVVGSVGYDKDRYAVVGPLIAGRVAYVRVQVGQQVQAGEPLADVESAEVGQAQATYLQAKARFTAAEANFRREKELAQERVSSAREKELAEAQYSTESAEVRAAEQRLRALGLRTSDIAALANAGGGTAGRLSIRSPIAGTVISRDITLGQAVQAATDAFKVADLSRLWIQLDLFERDLAYVHVGQRVEVRTEAFPGEVFLSKVAYIEPAVDEKTRTARVRVELPNPKQKLRPGQFVTAKIPGDPSFVEREVVAVPKAAVQVVDRKPLVFVETERGRFAKRDVELGVSSGELVEAKSGVKEGEYVAADGAFLLKSELLR